MREGKLFTVYIVTNTTRGVLYLHPTDEGARGAMLLGANFAGMAIEASMLGAAHACANPVAARPAQSRGRDRPPW